MEATVNGNVHSWGSIEIKVGGRPLPITPMRYEARGTYAVKLHPPSKRKQRQARVRDGLRLRAEWQRTRRAVRPMREPMSTTEAEARLLRMFGARNLADLADLWRVASVRVVRDLDGKLCIVTVARAYPEMIDVTVGFMTPERRALAEAACEASEARQGENVEEWASRLAAASVTAGEAESMGQTQEDA